MSQQPIPRQVVCAILERQGQFLLARRSPGQALSGLWELPGGKVELGETPIEALSREIFEELGWLIEPQMCVGLCDFVWKDRPFVLEAWTATAPTEGEPSRLVHDAFVWLDVRGALDPAGVYLSQISPADVPLLQAYADTLVRE